MSEESEPFMSSYYVGYIHLLVGIPVGIIVAGTSEVGEIDVTGTPVGTKVVGALVGERLTVGYSVG